MIELNALIKSARLEIEDHGILTVMIDLDYGDSGQGFGGFSLDYQEKGTGKVVGTVFAAEHLRRIMETVGVTEWSQLRGQLVRVRKEDGWNGRIQAIGHIINDTWYDPKAHAEEHVNE